jgi:hypothetical protein
MDAKTFSLGAGVIFAVVALLHLVRILMEWTVVIGDWSVPKSVSWVALIVAGGLALLGLRLGQREERGFRPPAVSAGFARAADRPGASSEMTASMRRGHVTTISRRETAHAGVTTPGHHGHGPSVICAFSAHHIRSVDSLTLGKLHRSIAVATPIK